MMNRLIVLVALVWATGAGAVTVDEELFGTTTTTTMPQNRIEGAIGAPESPRAHLERDVATCLQYARQRLSDAYCRPGGETARRELGIVCDRSGVSNSAVACFDAYVFERAGMLYIDYRDASGNPVYGNGRWHFCRCMRNLGQDVSWCWG